IAMHRVLLWGLTFLFFCFLFLFCFRSRRALHKQKDGTEFKSIYSLDKLYPESQGSDTAWRVPDGAKQADSDISLDRLTISYCRSSGPGGQNVNKVNSKVEVRFHLATADWIAEPVRQKIAIMHKNKINRLGELILTSESSRYQFRNLADCLSGQKLDKLFNPGSSCRQSDASMQKTFTPLSQYMKGIHRAT
uniref:Large ribosomal subunit protein mL62 n=1 Tax=Theropithecus gelada TaxID=9565 RepID=A0A8D2GFZ0_THEGE